MSMEMTQDEWDQMCKEHIDTDWEFLYNNQTEILAARDRKIEELKKLLIGSLEWVEHDGQLKIPFARECADKGTCLKCDIYTALGEPQ